MKFCAYNVSHSNVVHLHYLLPWLVSCSLCLMFYGRYLGVVKLSSSWTEDLASSLTAVISPIYMCQPEITNPHNSGSSCRSDKHSSYPLQWKRRRQEEQSSSKKTVSRRPRLHLQDDTASNNILLSV